MGKENTMIYNSCYNACYPVFPLAENEYPHNCFWFKDTV